jgi:hypothetical protein
MKRLNSKYYKKNLYNDPTYYCSLSHLDSLYNTISGDYSFTSIVKPALNTLYIHDILLQENIISLMLSRYSLYRITSIKVSFLRDFNTGEYSSFFINLK